MGKIVYVGAYDTTLDKFESQYEVPNGVTYNSYVIIDEKIAVLDTIDKRKGDEWFKNLDSAFDGRKPDYLIVSHMEPDHSANIETLANKYPEIKLVASKQAVPMLKNFTSLDIDARTIVANEGDTLSLGEHTLTFIMAPLVHWPEVMVEYESTTKTFKPSPVISPIYGILDKNYKTRLDIRQALNHPWIKASKAIFEEKENLGCLQNFLIKLMKFSDMIIK